MSWEREQFLSENIINNDNIILYQFYSEKPHKNKILLKYFGNLNNIKSVKDIVLDKFKYIFKKFDIKIKYNYLLIYYEFNDELINKKIYWDKNKCKDKIININGFYINSETNKYDLLLEGEDNFMFWLSEIKLLNE